MATELEAIETGYGEVHRGEKVRMLNDEGSGMWSQGEELYIARITEFEVDGQTIVRVYANAESDGDPDEAFEIPRDGFEPVDDDGDA